jgi:TonB family protein
MAHLGPSLRRGIVRERPGIRFALAVAVSLALNAGGAWLVVASGAFDVASRGQDAARVALAPMTAAQWEANRAVEGEKVPQPERAQPQDRKKGTVVELPPREPNRREEEAPRDSRFLAERNQKVDKETVSRFAGEYPEVAAKPDIAAPGRRAAGGGGSAQAPRKGAEGPKDERLALAPAPSGELPVRGDGEGGQRSRGEPAPDLSVGRETVAKVLAGPSMDGYREGLEEGDATHLNTSAFRYATFFNQVRNGFAQEFVPRLRTAIRDRDPDGSMFFYKDRTVTLALTLDTDGQLTDLRVVESSNVDFFDRLAVASFRAAQPFPNPPRGLFEGSQATRFPFIVTLYAGDSSPRIRWLWQGDR